MLVIILSVWNSFTAPVEFAFDNNMVFFKS